ncbi:MAG: bifunctional diaminohydroxyphosphoribosylaminopyrimidine deaminase/5-amino-6-(5-phosphoribosylamino)uracil reductase RibD [Actinobacteria bacterium]|nr:bifunctional diaminohydroxyphosphoribosylaminopyrimidine deaminase/5-amino-6-(5-phosphoribosylamino)uracil reductase RibD [Actinomycetota bacterium]
MGRQQAIGAVDNLDDDPSRGLTGRDLLGVIEDEAMRVAIFAGRSVRRATSPNPWVGSVLLPARTLARQLAVLEESRQDGKDLPCELDHSGWFVGATSPPGGPHAEVVALASAGNQAAGATLVTTLEPCSHHGRTPPCVDAIIAAGVSRVIIGTLDPDPNVSGSGLARLQEAGIETVLGVLGKEVEAYLAPYLKHRRTGRPWVVLKLAGTLDGRTAAADGSSRWITGPKARADVHELRALSDAILVGAGTVRADDPELTVRLDTKPSFQPLRVVLGRVPAGARVHPALELSGDLNDVLDELGRRGVLQVLVEGGPKVAYGFHSAGLIDRYVIYLAPALMGGSDGSPLLDGPGAASIGDIWRGQICSFRRLDQDLRIELAPYGSQGVPASGVV